MLFYFCRLEELIKRNPNYMDEEDEKDRSLLKMEKADNQRKSKQKKAEEKQRKDEEKKRKQEEKAKLKTALKEEKAKEKERKKHPK